MKGYVYYSAAESVRNHAFIDELIIESGKLEIELRLLIGDDQPDSDADFILFRDRDTKRATKFEMEGSRLFNRAEVNRIANDKLQTFELATLLGVPAVPTRKIRSIGDINSYPCVLKTVDGHGGDEVFLCTSAMDAELFFNKFHDRKLIVQPFIESGARDIRVFVIGNEVVGAVKRTGNGSFKSNYTLGGSVEKYILSSWQEKDVKTISRAIKSDYVGIDFILLPDGRWLLNEIEDPVGARSLYITHEFSVAEKLMGYIKEKLSGR
ncbi:ATP-grasp domain-containing protein [Sporosarcina sp. ANT_H38]|uniref:ATP-grasp domain-containing protein n=1 Tax=Sporosarcina sp. ANT_H38 TaxID=2597358 RepID=UPI0011F2CFCB|nr:ATP-grasp domain-containing protein [Sporosarcina sp. ANT_H38]KAA0965338.1 ATP-grasp domain-containing protein [Sporosarcina sp. ANT_H38]